MEGTFGIVIGLVATPTPCTSVVVHNSMIISMAVQPECSASRRNLLGMFVFLSVSFSLLSIYAALARQKISPQRG